MDLGFMTCTVTSGNGANQNICLILTEQLMAEKTCREAACECCVAARGRALRKDADQLIAAESYQSRTPVDSELSWAPRKKV